MRTFRKIRIFRKVQDSHEEGANKFLRNICVYQLTRRHIPEDLNLLIYLLPVGNQFSSDFVFLFENEAAVALFVMLKCASYTSLINS